jgi:hypothetical protein
MRDSFKGNAISKVRRGEAAQREEGRWKCIGEEMTRGPILLPFRISRFFFNNHSEFQGEMTKKSKKTEGTYQF